MRRYISTEPAMSESFLVRMHAAEKDRLRDLARKQGTSLANVVRSAIARAIDDTDEPQAA